MTELEKAKVGVEDVKVAVDDEYTFLSPACPVRRITVYADRAEVCRVINTKPKKGINEILLKNLPECIDGDSIRVEGKGEATIEEVSYQLKYIPQDEAQLNAKEQELKDLEKALLIEKEDLQSLLSVVKKQWEVLNGFARSATAGMPTAKKDEKETLLNDSYFEGIAKFLSLFKTEGKSLEDSRLTLERKLVDLQSKIDANAKNQGQVMNSRTGDESRECTIVLDASSETPVELVVSYVVNDASWIPSYDIRMFTAEGVMKIMYYGQIQQSTGEDWNDAKLFLSTASPSIGGAVPELESVFLTIKERVRYQSKRFSRKGGRKSLPNYVDQEVNIVTDFFGFCGDTSLSNSPPRPDITTSQTKVADTTTSTSYEIARLATIPSDNVQHKVSVGIIDLTPRMEYISIPKKVPRAFLTAKLTNTSQFTLLPGPTSIFLDNSFVAKAELKSVSPQEEFECSLGVDPSVRVIYKPMKKFQETTGFISKQRSVMHEQSIEIKNTHDYKIKILVKDNLPQSGVDKVKVNLVEPVIDLKHPEKNKDIRINTKQNHIEWDLEVGKQETRTITLKYTVELPASEEINTQERLYES
ncbi:protein F37C4.5 isoform X2 [Patella vulgata]|uniref:protein F37C4.5 isoform X2 n=1 Tax=Patella vulgata TaxID=6465 RepID=UPI0024A8A894|nr:protein F37C4.5 isoform X2 [Patella vulgata]